MGNNICLSGDSYKCGHWNQYLPGTTKVYSYFESRAGAKYPYTVFFGLQYILKKYLTGQVVTMDKILEAKEVLSKHFGTDSYFNFKGWEYIANYHNGRLPIKILAVPEGTCVETGNVLMTVENTDPNCFWLTNFLETILAQVWYPSTVATLSRTVKEFINGYLNRTAESNAGLPFMLHDFGYRGVSSNESAAIGGAAHLVNFLGTDTIPAMSLLREYYGATLENLAFSVAATEHSIMTAAGLDGEPEVVAHLLKEYPKGILSVVSDSYDIEHFVTKILGEQFKEQILARDGVFVVRPDSVRGKWDNPGTQVLWIARRLGTSFGETTNSKGFKVINPKVRILWGDGIDDTGINHILNSLQENGYSAENIATFGMGGGLLQKINRDTQRFAFKCSYQERNGEAIDIFKSPKDSGKASKAGRLALSRTKGTVPYPAVDDTLVCVFYQGALLRDYNFWTVRERAKL